MKTEELDTLHNAVAGGSAAFFSSLTLCPTELIKCRLQTLNEVNKAGISNVKQNMWVINSKYSNVIDIHAILILI